MDQLFQTLIPNPTLLLLFSFNCTKNRQVATNSKPLALNILSCVVVLLCYCVVVLLCCCVVVLLCCCVVVLLRY